MEFKARNLFSFKLKIENTKITKYFDHLSSIVINIRLNTLIAVNRHI
ncbi:hypothetical protein HME9304_03342 [Flagellimonas maritima]|uniref:Uncharacterized protein n=1 Tax=Flagellimonas maritima TaxID=1383885 RepID=A0A2Z4LX22_9FLAO|nr:hypothetical protein HME9304_03342 [Allomuricauda aurantiaca]